jgi:alpha-tubulin suppressor-like RCC1 family protein
MKTKARSILLQALEFPEEIIQVAAGATFHLALGKSTNVYSYGNSSRHALGRTLRETVADNWTCGIVQLNPKRPIVRVTCGFEHSLVLTADGEIYSWGLGMAYQLGTNIRHNTNIPTKVITPPGIVWKDIAAGYYHSAALTTTNEIYTWGSNSDGALGILSVGTDEFTGSPTRSETPFQAKMIACGLYHTSAVDVNGKLWGTGLNNTGQLGTGDINTCRAWTKAINVDSLNFVFLSCGWVMTFVITDTSEMYSCGRDTSGELGHEAKTQTTLVRVCEPPNVKWSKVSGGCYTSAALSKAIL